MRILISNDDGVRAPGLALLAGAARELSDDVLIVAPERKWTAASHQLTFDRDQTLTRIDTNVYACSGAPADCIVAAMTVLHAAPALVLSGVNDKRNVGEDEVWGIDMRTADTEVPRLWHSLSSASPPFRGSRHGIRAQFRR